MGNQDDQERDFRPPGSGWFDDLLAAHQRRIYFYIRTMVFNPEDAKDILQEVNMIVLRKRDRFTPGTNFKSWSFAIARFECLAYLSRRKKNLDIGFLPEDVAEQVIERAAERADEIEPWFEALEKCRRGLPDDAALLIDRRYHKRVPMKVLAEELQTSEGALKQKLLRIRHRLKRCILARTHRKSMEISRNVAEKTK